MGITYARHRPLTDVIGVASEKSRTKVFRIMPISPDWIQPMMFIMVEVSSKRRGSRYDSMLVPELSSYNDMLDDIDAPFSKPPNDDNYDGLLAASTDTGVRILRIRCDPGGGYREDDDTDVAAVYQ